MPGRLLALTVVAVIVGVMAASESADRGDVPPETQEPSQRRSHGCIGFSSAVNIYPASLYVVMTTVFDKGRNGAQGRSDWKEHDRLHTGFRETSHHGS